LAKPIKQTDQSSGKEVFSGDDNWKILAGKKRKALKVYMRKTSMAESLPNAPLLLALGPSETTSVSEGVESDGLKDDSNKKMKRTSVMFLPRSADQAGAVEQPRQTQ
jgi:hypothetical protein